MAVYDNNLGKFFGPSSSYTGYVFIACGIFASAYSLLALTLLLPGVFMSFTFNGIIIDIDKKKLRPYTALFGIFKTGRWIDADQFTRFSIIKATKKYTSYSRANVEFNLSVSDIELILTDRNGKKKVILNKYKNFEDAQREMEELGGLICYPARKELV